MIAATTATVASLPAVRVLARSFTDHHPGERLVAVVVDARPGAVGAEEPFDVLPADGLGLPADDLAAMTVMYPPEAVAAALKPTLLAHLLTTRSGVVAYLAPSLTVRRPLTRLAEAVERSPARTALAARLVAPVPDDGRRPGPLDARRAGPVDADVLAVAAGAEPLLAWWAAHLRRDCVDEPANGIVLDGGWLDLAIGAYPVGLLDGLVGSVWTLHAGTLEELDPELLYLGDVDPERPWLLSPEHAGFTPRLLLSERPDLRRAVRERVAALAEAARPGDDALGVSWLALGDGTPIDRRIRHLYRAAYKMADAGVAGPPPPAFAPGTAPAAIEWLNSPPPGSPTPLVSRYLELVYGERIDLLSAFPDLAGRDADGFLRWCLEHGRTECSIPDALLPRTTPDGGIAPAGALPPEPSGAEASAAAARDPDRAGLNVAGYFRSILGLGDAARSLVEAIDAADIPRVLVVNDDTLSEAAYEVDDVPPDRAPHDVNLLCVTADRTPAFARTVGRSFFEGRHTIGLWYWETDALTADMVEALGLVDEIWVTSPYGVDLFRPHTTKPIVELPLPVARPAVPPGITRRDLGLPEDRFTFLFTFDFLSTPARKNPEGLVDAFTCAFAPDEGPVLVIKSTNADQRIHEAERLRVAAADRADIVLLDRYVSDEEQLAYLALADCYASLHRSEGFGLGLAQAMALGKPVVGTAYSGNLAFMTDDNSYLVPAETVTVGPGSAPYPPEGHWADPDLDVAARVLRRVWEAPDEAAARGARAAADLAAGWSVDAAAAAIAARWRDLRAELAVRPRPVPAQPSRATRLTERVGARFPRRR